MPTTYGNDIVYCLKSHCGVRGYCRQKWVLQVQIICKFSNERTCKRNKDVQGLSCGFEDIYRKRWEIELLFKQMKQNFPLKYFYGESANAIKIQIWVTLIANFLLMLMRKSLTRSWSFSGLATMVRITLMYYVDFYSLFNDPEKEWEEYHKEGSDCPP